MADGILHAYLDGALDALDSAGELPDGASAADVIAHLESCADCRARLESERVLRERAGFVLSAAAPTGELRPFSEISGQAARARRPRTWLPMAWAASVMLAVGAGWWGSEIWRTDTRMAGQESFYDAAPTNDSDAVGYGAAAPAAATDAPLAPADNSSAPSPTSAPQVQSEASAPPAAPAEPRALRAGADARVAGAGTGQQSGAAAPGRQGAANEAARGRSGDVRGRADEQPAEGARRGEVAPERTLARTPDSVLGMPLMDRAERDALAFRTQPKVTTTPAPPPPAAAPAAAAPPPPAVSQQRAEHMEERAQDPRVTLFARALERATAPGAAWRPLARDAQANAPPPIGIQGATTADVAVSTTGTLVRVRQRLDTGDDVDIFSWREEAVALNEIAVTGAAQKTAESQRRAAPPAAPRAISASVLAIEELGDGRRQMIMRLSTHDALIAIRTRAPRAVLESLAARLVLQP